MNQVVWKYKLSPNRSVIEHFTIKMPKGSRILDIHIQSDDIAAMWVLVDTDEKQKETRKFRIFPTGATIEAAQDYTYVGTFYPYMGALVFHVFEYE